MLSLLLTDILNITSFSTITSSFLKLLFIKIFNFCFENLFQLNLNTLKSTLKVSYIEVGSKIKMVEVIFKGGSIQTGERIKIPPAIIDTLGLKAGDKIIILFDAEKREIIVKEEKEVKEGKVKKKK